MKFYHCYSLLVVNYGFEELAFICLQTHILASRMISLSLSFPVHSSYQGQELSWSSLWYVNFIILLPLLIIVPVFSYNSCTFSFTMSEVTQNTELRGMIYEYVKQSCLQDDAYGLHDQSFMRDQKTPG